MADRYDYCWLLYYQRAHSKATRPTRILPTDREKNDSPGAATLLTRGTHVMIDADSIPQELPMELGLVGKIAIVGGSSKGLGRACAEGLAREGAKVVVCSRNVETLEQI